MKDSGFRRLNFPRRYDFDVRTTGGRTVILDPLRRRYVALTPEEWVRQNLIQFLIQDRGCPGGLISVEKPLDFHGKLFRADVVVHDRRGTPMLLAECKEPSVSITQEVFDQIAAYNRVVRARYLLVTNGFTHYCYVVDPEEQTCRFLEELPLYEDL